MNKASNTDIYCFFHKKNLSQTNEKGFLWKY